MKNDDTIISIDQIISEIREVAKRHKTLDVSYYEKLSTGKIDRKTNNYEARNPIYATQESKIFKVGKKINSQLKKTNVYSNLQPCINKIKNNIPDDLKYKKGIPFRELLKYDDTVFVENLYRVVLKREPDPEGFNNNLNRIRNGISKLEILGSIRFSEEGKAKNVNVLGLKWRYSLYRLSQNIYKIPIFGYMIKIFIKLIFLPQISQKQNNEYVMIQGRISDVVEEINLKILENEGITEKLSNDIETTIVSLLKKVEELQGEIEESKRELQGEIEGSKRELQGEIEGSKRELQGEIEGSKRELQGEIEGSKRELQGEIEGSKRELQEEVEENKIELQETIQKTSQENKRELQKYIDSINYKVHDLKLNILEEQRRITLLLEEARKRFPNKISAEQLENMIKEEDHMLDAMYVSFEDKFRGTRKDIKNRLLPYIKKLDEVHGNNKENINIVDLGCGRGEWLELLKENGYTKSKGIDLNRIMIKVSKEYGLDVEEYDAVEYLRGLKTNQVDVVTGFHIVEHLPTKVLVSMLDEILRVLKPGGIVILETPNPENILVGACNFYTDPTHKNPLPPDTLKFLLEARGFSRTEILRLHPMNYLKNEVEGESKHIVFRFNMEQDYSVLAVKL